MIGWTASPTADPPMSPKPISLDDAGPIQRRARFILLVAFGSTPALETLARYPADRTLVLSDRPPGGGLAWEPLEASLATSCPADSVGLLEELNALTDPSGRPYPRIIGTDDERPWWFHQQLAFDLFLAPFALYRPLLARCSGADEVVVYDAPDDFRRLTALLPANFSFAPEGSTSRRCPPASLRHAASWIFYRLMTLSATGKALVRRPDVLVYGVDVADKQGRIPSIDGLYRALERRRRSFTEIVWSRGGAHAVRQWRTRRRAVIHVQAVTPSTPAFRPRRGTSVTSAADVTEYFLRNLAEFVLVPRARWSTRAIRRFEILISILRPRGVFLMDDYLHTFELIAACRRRGVPTVALQHGQFNRTTVGIGFGYRGLPLFADRYCVWSGFFRGLIEREGGLVASASVVVGGLPRSTSESRSAVRSDAIAGPPIPAMRTGALARTELGSPPDPHREPDSARLPRVLFIAEQHDDLTTRREVAPYVRALVEAGFAVRIRPHPAQPDGGALTAALRMDRPPSTPSSLPSPHALRAATPGHPGESKRRTAASGLEPERPSAPQVWNDSRQPPPDRRPEDLPPRIALARGPLPEELESVDVVVASFSSAIFDALWHRRPVVLFPTNRHDDPHGLAEHGFADRAVTPAEIAARVGRASRLPERELERRRIAIWGSTPDGGETAVRLMEELSPGFGHSRYEKIGDPPRT
jgi:hypothetical protein